MIKRILHISLVILLPLISYGSPNEMKYLLVEDPSSPLKKEAIEKRNLKIHEITSRGKVDEWKKSERKRGGRIENWEEDQIRKEMEKINLWNGGAIYEKKMGVFVVRFGTWGQKDGMHLLRIEW